MLKPHEILKIFKQFLSQSSYFLCIFLQGPKEPWFLEGNLETQNLGIILFVPFASLVKPQLGIKVVPH